jgi:hypothetical protein
MGVLIKGDHGQIGELFEKLLYFAMASENPCCIMINNVYDE